MALIATLVVGSNGATSKAGQSAPLSTAADRRRFLTLHRSAGAIITGSNSAQIEDYSKTSVPIFVFTRSSAKLTFSHPMMQQITVDRGLAEIARRIDQRIEGDVVIEAGPRLLQALLEVKAIDSLELSISPVDGDGDFIEIEKILAHFLIEGTTEIDGTQLLQCRYNRNPTDG